MGEGDLFHLRPFVFTISSLFYFWNYEAMRHNQSIKKILNSEPDNELLIN